MAAAAPKRGPFSKPSWASKSTDSTKAAPDSIFGNRVYEGILEAERRRKETEAAKLQAGRETLEKQESEPSSKRRRISVDTCNDDNTVAYTRRDDSNSQNSAGASSTRSTPRKTAETANFSSPQSPAAPTPANVSGSRAAVIELADDEVEDDDLYGSSAATAAPKSTPKKSKTLETQRDAESASEDEDDEYMRELKHRAREKARLQKLSFHAEQPLSVIASTNTARSPSDEHIPSASPLNNSSQVPTAAKPPKPVDDPTLRLLITTKIPGGKPLIVTRRASQTLKQVKEFWCQRQGFQATMTAKIFLTWRGTKLWNSSTMQGPLKKLKQERPLETFDIKDEDNDDVNEHKGGRIEIVAMTEELLQEYLRDKERQETATVEPDADGNRDHNSRAVDRSSPARPTEVTRPTVRDDNSIVIRLTSQGLEPMLLRVRPSTEVHRIMAGFKKTRKLDLSKTAWLVFDGRRLDAEETVGAVELEHEDTVEVHVR